MRVSENASSEALERWWLAEGTEEGVEAVNAFLQAARQDRLDLYQWHTLQTEPHDRFVVYMPVRGLVAIVDVYLDGDPGREDLVLELLNVVFEPDATGSEPWGLP